MDQTEENKLPETDTQFYKDYLNFVVPFLKGTHGIDTQPFQDYLNYIVPILKGTSGIDTQSMKDHLNATVQGYARAAEALKQRMEAYEAEMREQKRREQESHQAILKALAWQKWACIGTAVCALVGTGALIVATAALLCGR